MTQTYVAAGPLQFALDDARRAGRSFWREGPALFRHWILCFAPHWVFDTRICSGSAFSWWHELTVVCIVHGGPVAAHGVIDPVFQCPLCRVEVVLCHCTILMCVPRGAVASG